MTPEAEAYYDIFDKVIFRKNEVDFDCPQCGYAGRASATVDLEGEIGAKCPACGQGYYVGEVGKVELFEVAGPVMTRHLAIATWTPRAATWLLCGAFAAALGAETLGLVDVSWHIWALLAVGFFAAHWHFRRT